jgi:hypothetical protein
VTVFSVRGCGLEAVINTKALCRRIAGQALQEDYIGLQHCHQLILPLDRYLLGCKDRAACERHLWATGLPPSKKTRLLQLGDVPSQLNAVGLIYMTLSIFVAAATHHFTIIIGTRYVPFIFMPESSGVGRVLSVPEEHSQWPPTWILKNCLLNLLLLAH